MDESHLQRANRALLRAIETPPDTGCEADLDRIAATLWALANREGYRPDPGQLCRLRHALTELEAESTAERAAHVERARSHLRSVQAAMDSSV